MSILYIFIYLNNRCIILIIIKLFKAFPCIRLQVRLGLSSGIFWKVSMYFYNSVNISFIKIFELNLMPIIVNIISNVVNNRCVILN